MSESGKRASGREPAEPQNDFVLDFLYNDARRIGAFLAQFDDSGHLQRVIQREGTARGFRRGFKFNIGGGATVAGNGGQGSIGVERGPGEMGSEDLEREYDPLWANALTLLDYLTLDNLIHDDLPTARIGQFVRVSGALNIRDLRALQPLWDQPEVRKKMGISHADNRIRKERRANTQLSRGGDEIAFAMDVIKCLPHIVTARIQSSHGLEVWSSIHEEYMAGSTSDLFFKHGPAISGEWSMIGILDAEPDTGSNIPTTTDGASMEVLTHGFSFLLDTLTPMARILLGRPAAAYGMTPLVIYRKIESA